jgi:hypothetical protein
VALGDAVRPITDTVERAATEVALKLLSNELSQRQRVLKVIILQALEVDEYL